MMQHPAPAPEESKLDPYTRMHLEENKLGERFECLMRTSKGLTPEQRKAMEDLGVTIRTEIGEILVAEMPVASLEGVLKLDFVKQVEGGRPLYPEN